LAIRLTKEAKEVKDLRPLRAPAGPCSHPYWKIDICGSILAQQGIPVFDEDVARLQIELQSANP
jgi:hypothetical protein